MTAPTVNTAVPTWAARNAKFLWAVAALLLTVATDVANSYASFIPAAWLPALHAVILGLTAIGVQRDSNAVGVAEVVHLVQHVLPGHTLVALPAAEDVLKAAETAVAPSSTTSSTPASSVTLPAGTADLSAAMDAALAGTPAAAAPAPVTPTA